MPTLGLHLLVINATLYGCEICGGVVGRWWRGDTTPPLIATTKHDRPMLMPCSLFALNTVTEQKQSCASQSHRHPLAKDVIFLSELIDFCRKKILV